jgi:sigma-B regulation protein RsbQ
MSIFQRNHITVVGNGSRTMLLAHGYGCDQIMWRYLVPAFQDAYRVVLFDHVGAGKSDSSQYSRLKYGTLEGYAWRSLMPCPEHP